ncbi:MAG: GTP-binding protein, partial [Gammaproteobacteria bacterium]|nr:GTP-binding protein [Gammaproteobacteria bacterium]MDX2486255.1 GTP-binding protein [Gammaproteobacteria bacterium]
SVTEGDDKPAKYPVIFRAADLVLLTKADLLEVLDDFDPAKAEEYIRQLASEVPVLQLAARRNVDIDSWLNWLRNEVKEQRKRVKKKLTLRPAVQPEGSILHSGHDHSHDHHPHSHPHKHDKPHSHS